MFIFRLGFGSFAEKPIMPFISMDKGRRANPCSVEEVACEPTYAYKHHLSLTNKVTSSKVYLYFHVITLTETQLQYNSNVTCERPLVLNHFIEVENWFSIGLVWEMG